MSAMHHSNPYAHCALYFHNQYIYNHRLKITFFNNAAGEMTRM